MQRKTLAIGVALLPLIFMAGARANAAGAFRPDTEAVIDAEAHCFSSGGINIDFAGSDSAKVACMENKQVQRACGQDGVLTRQQAFTQWYHKLEQFQAHCSTEGGTFAFQDTNFKEPPNESYCLQAQPEIGTNMFEESLCNYRSVCPAVTVICSHGLGNIAHLPTPSDDLRSE